MSHINMHGVHSVTVSYINVFKIPFIVSTTETTECNLVSFAEDRFCLWSPGEAAAESTFYAERNRSSMCRLCRLLKGFDFHCSSLVLLFGRKTVLAMKNSTAPTQVDAASSGSTASSYVSGPKQVYEGNIALFTLEHSKSVCCRDRVKKSALWGCHSAKSECKLHFVKALIRRERQDPVSPTHRWNLSQKFTQKWQIHKCI